jgi:hypothetical protein
VIKFSNIQVSLWTENSTFMLTLENEKAWVPLVHGGLNNGGKLTCISSTSFGNDHEISTSLNSLCLTMVCTLQNLDKYYNFNYHISFVTLGQIKYAQW